MNTTNGLCECGCGRPTRLATRNRRERGQVRGQPLRFITGHTGNVYGFKPGNLTSTAFKPGNVVGIKHGHAARGRHTPEHRTWVSMKQRIFNPNTKGYENYGGRGLEIEPDFIDSFEAFLEHVGPKPDWATGGLDRIDNDLGYVRGNLRWSTWDQQNANQRPRSRAAA